MDLEEEQKAKAEAKKKVASGEVDLVSGNSPEAVAYREGLEDKRMHGDSRFTRPSTFRTVRASRQKITLEDAIGSHDFAPLEALAGV
jgi:hypothetical protein